MHEHISVGCIDCVCSASYLNISPCTCPPDMRGEMQDRKMLDGTPVQQTSLRRWVHPQQSYGEVTQVKKGRTVTLEVEIDPAYEDLIDSVQLNLELVFAPAMAKPKILDEPHIIRGEN